MLTNDFLCRKYLKVVFGLNGLGDEEIFSKVLFLIALLTVDNVSFIVIV